MAVKPGGRVVPLYTPLPRDGGEVTVVTFRPFTLDDAIRWQDGAFASPLALMAACTDEPKLREIDLRQMAFPSFGVVLDEWLAYLPASVRNSVSALLDGLEGYMARPLVETAAPAGDDGASSREYPGPEAPAEEVPTQFGRRNTREMPGGVGAPLGRQDEPLIPPE